MIGLDKGYEPKITECKFHNKLLTFVEQHSRTACFQNAFLSFGFDTYIMVNSPLASRLILQSDETSVCQLQFLTDFR